MTEVLGVVASGIAVGTLAAKVTQGVVKLKNCRSRVKNVPGVISLLVLEVDALNGILDHIAEGQGVESGAVENTCLKKSLDLML